MKDTNGDILRFLFEVQCSLINLILFHRLGPYWSSSVTFYKFQQRVLQGTILSIHQNFTTILFTVPIFFTVLLMTIVVVNEWGP